MSQVKDYHWSVLTPNVASECVPHLAPKVSPIASKILNKSKVLSASTLVGTCPQLSPYHGNSHFIIMESHSFTCHPTGLLCLLLRVILERNSQDLAMVTSSEMFVGRRIELGQLLDYLTTGRVCDEMAIPIDSYGKPIAADSDKKDVKVPAAGEN